MMRVLAAFLSLGLASCSVTTFPNFSHWDSIPSIANFPADEAPAVIHRASRGLETDTAYRSRARQSRQRPEILWGAYHFGTGANLQTQLNLALERVGYHPNAAHRTLMAFDFEHNVKGRNDHMTVGNLAELIRRFHAKTGVYPVIYVNPGWFNRRLKTDSHTAADLKVIRNCPLWTSAYKAKPAAAEVFRPWVIWQYAGDASQSCYCDFVGPLASASYPRGVGGIGAKLEMNAFKGSAEELRQFWQRHSIPTRY